MLTRNPYLRLESFFKDKLRKNVLIHKGSDWQDCQKVFFKHLEIDLKDTNDNIRLKLLDTGFQDFIMILPEVYLKEAHLFPQSYNKYIETSLLNYKLRLELKNVLAIKVEDDIEDFFKTFKLNLAIKRNYTFDINEQLEWSEEMIEIVNRLYHKDFQLFGYVKK